MGRTNRTGCSTAFLQLFGLTKREQPLPYRIKKSILTANEVAIYRVLIQVIGDKLIVFAQVRLSDIFRVSTSQGYQAALNRINSKHIDFLLCQPGTCKPVLAIELDDRSHERADRRDRDDFVNRLFKQPDAVPLLRIKAMMRYDAAEIRDKIVAALQLQKRKK